MLSCKFLHRVITCGPELHTVSVKFRSVRFVECGHKTRFLSGPVLTGVSTAEMSLGMARVSCIATLSKCVELPVTSLHRFLQPLAVDPPSNTPKEKVNFRRPYKSFCCVAVYSFQALNQLVLLLSC